MWYQNNGVSNFNEIKMFIIINWFILKIYDVTLAPGFSAQNDVIFSAQNVTMSRGDRVCLDVVIVDDNIIEYTESFYFTVSLSNGSYISDYYQKSTGIEVIDNDGECEYILYI